MIKNSRVAFIFLTINTNVFASNEVKFTIKDFSAEKDPANNCLDTAIITDPNLRTKKTMKKLQYIAGRVLNKKKWKSKEKPTGQFGLKKILLK